ncbi:FeoB small GTPase domain-containing protein [Candidatus Chloroploca asiatica]|uniref:Fe(2+) transporter FeoB n=1 Tax=Candidatus Chloroploca asiatica TaxID=1506545 RepID=A0A2H3KNT9_9CHLR|nr:FeoB small GTPase domain-containing protein [Candidatus Chloroploca asiatica]PDV99817.1 iron transporter FeoB [Candidatus Chloroploca asiatica]
MADLTIALAGNPNVGKSTLFNALTGRHQHVGNWPGKTVAKQEGKLMIEGKHLTIIDLPGTYSLSAHSPEEEIARNFIVCGRPDAVVNVLDAANLERNLYLSAQILETGVPMILVLNMTDVATARGLQIHPEVLSTRLGIPVITMAASRGQGLGELKRLLATIARTPREAMLGSSVCA